MAGSLKVTCATGARGWAYTAPFGTLNAQSNFTFSCWFQIGSITTGAVNLDIAAAVTSYPVNIGIQNATHFVYAARNADNSKVIGVGPVLDTKGHFVVISYNATGTTTIYVDGAPAATLANIGVTATFDQVINLGLNAGVTPAITAYLKDVAIWGGYSAIQSDVIALRDGAKTPGTLATPATNWWTLQGPAGAVTDGTQGLADQLGGVNLATFHDAGASLVYDPHEIVLSFSALMMTPYCNITGTHIYVPLYLDPVSTIGGPALPVMVNIAPVFKLNGSTIVPTLVPMNPFLYAIVYQMPSGTSVSSGDTLTMAAPMGWASTTAGLVGGTSGGGTGSAPLTVTNYAGQDTEFPTTKTLKVGYNVPSYGISNNVPGQPRANFASRLWKGDPLVQGGWIGGTVLTYDPTTQLPATLSGQAVGILQGSINNGVDGRGTPSTEGTWKLVYGDSTPGVTSNPSTGHMLTVALGGTASETVVSPGMWDGSAWRGITKTYTTVSSPSPAGFATMPSVLIDSIAAGGAVAFPSKGNGQVELGVFPPSPIDRTVSSPPNWDPLGIDPEYLLKHQGAHCLRWMADIGGNTVFGDSSMLTVADLDQRQVDDFLWTKQQPAVICNVIKVEPIGATFNAILDYQGTTQSMSGANWHDAGFTGRVPMLCTTDIDHTLRTGDLFFITGTIAAPEVVAKQDSLVLAAAITVTTSPITFTVNTTSPPMAIGDVVLIGSEQLTVTGISGASVTCTRPTAGTTAATHAINTPVYTNFLTGAIATTSGPTTISVSRNPGSISVFNTLQIDSEQVTVTAVNSPTSVTVDRAVCGTTGATHAIGAIIYPGVLVNVVSGPGFVTGARTFVIGPSNTWLPFAGDAFITNPTIKATVNYTPPNCPVFSLTRPNSRGSVPYEFAVKTTGEIATAKASETICWINFALLVTDDLVTYVFENIAAIYATTNQYLRFIAELSNEVWNGGDPQSLTAAILCPTAPNPETSGTGFNNSQEFVVSRQNHITGLAKAAFVATGLDPARVYNFQPGNRQIGFAQGGQNVRVAYCQLHGIPIDYLSMDGYVDITKDVWDLFWSWMPASDGGSASWSRAMARRVMMSYFRAWCWFSAYFGSAIAGSGQVLSWYKAGKSVANAGVGTATANTGLGRICFYESATEFLTDDRSNFVNQTAMIHDLTYDGIPQWVGDTGWGATEEAYYAAKQGAGLMYAALMPSASFPDLPSATPTFTCYYSSVYEYGAEGEAWLLYNWQGQQPGNGATNTMGWSATAPVAEDYRNQSVRAQTAIDWIAATNTGGLTSYVAPWKATIIGEITVTQVAPGKASVILTGTISDIDPLRTTIIA